MAEWDYTCSVAVGWAFLAGRALRDSGANFSLLQLTYQSIYLSGPMPSTLLVLSYLIHVKPTILILILQMRILRFEKTKSLAQGYGQVEQMC